jgi:voltage-gated sodium channel
VQLAPENPNHALISRLDRFFTFIFAAELLMNMFANWFHPFVSNRWNFFDVIVIVLSLIALALADLPINVLRLVRAFRVFRLFGRMQALKNILASLSASIVPELNAFMIMFIVISICEPF